MDADRCGNPTELSPIDEQGTAGGFDSWDKRQALTM